MKVKLKKDGLVVQPKDEFQSFVARACCSATSFKITIPKAIAEFIDLAPNDLLEVAVRKVTEQYALKNYRGVPTSIRSHIRKYKHTYVRDTRKYELPPLRSKNKILCPVCGKYGTLVQGKQKKKYQYLRFHHFKCDGFEQATEHSISKRRFPEFWAQHIKDKEEA